jgi:hypothetical protein
VPGASVDISYSTPGDFLKTFSVVKYGQARALATRAVGPAQEATIIILDGGVPVWQFHADTGLMSHFGFDKSFGISKVTYGKLPRNFIEDTPGTGPPEPLETGHYYVFSVSRNSGAQSFQVVKINDDGSLSSYAAQPLAGNSSKSAAASVLTSFRERTDFSRWFRLRG